jgi:hypothetical protein
VLAQATLDAAQLAAPAGLTEDDALPRPSPDRGGLRGRHRTFGTSFGGVLARQ